MDNIFKQLRQSKNLTMRALEEEIKIGHSHICELEKGKEPSISELKKYHRYFDVPYEVLLKEQNDTIPENICQYEGTLEAQLQEYKNSNHAYEREIYNTIEFLLKTNQGLAILTLLSKRDEIDPNKIAKLHNYLLAHNTDHLALSELVVLANRL